MQQIKVKFDELIQALRYVEAETSTPTITVEIEGTNLRLKTFDKNDKTMEIKITNTGHFPVVIREERLV